MSDDVPATFRNLPRRFGDYTLLTILSRGGMGEVSLARRAGLAGAQRLCVIKTVRADLKAEREYIDRFIDEARLAVTLAHPAICHVFDAGRVDDVLYLAMEHIAGVTLRDVIETLGVRSQTIPVQHALWIMLELLDALDYAHHAVHSETGLPLSVVHRDVSPQNVMVSFDGDVKLIDFGLAHSKLKALKTGEDHVMGKIAYMAPEQVQGAVLDGRADQYAAAIVLFETLTGERFYGDLDRAKVTKLVAAGGHRPASLEKLETGIVIAIERALATDRELRHKDCAEMAAALRLELARLDPLQSRNALRTWLQRTLAAEIGAHRELLRTLPVGDAPEDREHDTDQDLKKPEAAAQHPASESGSTSNSDSSQKARVLEAPKTEEMKRPAFGAFGSAHSSDEDSAATLVDARRPAALEQSSSSASSAPSAPSAPSLELDRPMPAPNGPASRTGERSASGANIPKLPTGPMGSSALSDSGAVARATSSLMPLPVMLGGAAVLVLVVAVLAWMATR